MCLRYMFIFKHAFKRFSRIVAKIASLWLLSVFSPKTPTRIKKMWLQKFSAGKKRVTKVKLHLWMF